MLELYWGCLIFGVLFALLSVVLGDFLSDMFDGMFDFLSLDGPQIFQPMIIVGFITGFGGSGVILTDTTNFPQFIIVITSLLAAFILSIIVYFTYVKPMQNAEASTGFTYQDLVGKVGEVSIPLPARGYGEVFLQIGSSNTNQIAASFDEEDIPSGTKVVVVEIREETLYVSPLNDL